VKKLFKWLGIVFGLLIAAVLALQVWFFAHIWWWVDHNPSSTSFMRAQLAVIQKTNPDAQLKHRWIAYNKISDNLKRAVIASEDANFTEHEGVDWDAIEKAYEKNLKKGKVVRGGSTITMQLAKNLFLSGDRSYIRKAQEIVITYMIENMMDKDRIFEIYLNVAEWGVGVFGAEAGAMHHFNVSAAKLAPMQAARMAAMLPRPRYYDKNRSSNALNRKANMIVRGMGSVEAP
jgi:monofunctional glycosyltransferase